MSLKNAIGGVALIAGTAIGAAILALPVATAHLGFTQTIAVYCICWFFMTMGALYLLEANLSIGHDCNLITMAQRTLGSSGKGLMWVFYLVLLYALLAAYLTGAGAWVQMGSRAFNLGLSAFSSALVATALTMAIIFMGTAFTDRVNRFLMIGLISAFFSMLWITADKMELAHFLTQPHAFDVRPIPLIITAFGSAIVIPTLTAYLHGQPRQLFRVVLLGSLIPLLVYIVWEMTIVGIIPFSGSPGLLQIQRNEWQQFENNELRSLVTDIPTVLNIYLKHPWITTAASYFSIFALITSLLGVCLSLFDFLADGMHIHKNLLGKIKLSIITFLPPLVFVLFYPSGFSYALSFAGAIVAVILGIMPALMVWNSRYRLKLPAPLRIVGGKAFLIITLAFFVGVIAIEGVNQYEAYKARQMQNLARSFPQE